MQSRRVGPGRGLCLGSEGLGVSYVAVEHDLEDPK